MISKFKMYLSQLSLTSWTNKFSWILSGPIYQTLTGPYWRAFFDPMNNGNYFAKHYRLLDSFFASQWMFSALNEHDHHENPFLILETLFFPSLQTTVIFFTNFLFPGKRFFVCFSFLALEVFVLFLDTAKPSYFL